MSRFGLPLLGWGSFILLWILQACVFWRGMESIRKFNPKPGKSGGKAKEGRDPARVRKGSAAAKKKVSKSRRGAQLAELPARMIPHSSPINCPARP